MMRRAPRLPALEFQHALRGGHIGIRRNDINVIRCDPQFVGDFAHRHRSDPRENLRQRALVIRAQMLHQHKTHACVGWQMLQQLCESFQPARRRADANDRKGGGGIFGRWRSGRELFNRRQTRFFPPPIFASAMFSYLAILFQASSFIYPWSAPTFFSLHSTVSKGSFWDGGTLVRRVDILGSLVMLQ